MPQVHVEIKNLEQIKAAFGRTPQLMSRHFNSAIQKATFLIQSKSMMATPVDTGFLRSSHRTSFSGGGLGFSGTVEPTAYYAGFVHEGTKFMRGRPFLKQAAEGSVSTIDQIFTQAMQSVLDDIARMT